MAVFERGLESLNFLPDAMRDALRRRLRELGGAALIVLAVVLALRRRGFQDVSCVQNKTVVTNAFKGEDLNHYLPILRAHGVRFTQSARRARCHCR